MASEVYKIRYNNYVFQNRFTQLEILYKETIKTRNFKTRNLKIKDLEIQLKQAQDKYSNFTDIKIIDRNDSSFLEREELNKIKQNIMEEIQISTNNISKLTQSLELFFENIKTLKMCDADEYDNFKNRYHKLLNTHNY